MKLFSSFFHKSLLVSVGFLLFLPVVSFSQTAPTKQWDKTIGGSHIDEFSSLQQTSDGGYILGGYSNSGISGDKSQANQGLNDFWALKLDASGNKLWDKTIGGNHEDYLSSLQQTSDGGYILGGGSSSGISGDKSQVNKGVTDLWIIKLDATGNKLWDKTYGGSGGDYLSSLHQTSDGGYILGGGSISGISGDKSQANKGNWDYWIVKLDVAGNKLWDKTIGGNSEDHLLSLQQTSDGGYILGGWSTSGINGDKSQSGNGGADYWIVKLDAAGNKVWDKTIGGFDHDTFSSLQQTSDGGYILGGYSNSGISGDKSQVSKGLNDFWLVKLNTAGDKLWDKTIGGSENDFLSSLQQTSDGGYILVGESMSGISGDKSQASKGYHDYWVVKLDIAGNKLWDKTIGGSSDELLFGSIMQTTDGGYILGGASDSGISGDKTQASQGATDIWIVKLGADITGVNESISNSQLSISPNPSNGKFMLQLNDISASKVEVTVSDLVGRIVLQKELPAANKQVSEELEIKATKGLYLLQIKAGDKSISRKIVVE